MGSPSPTSTYAISLPRTRRRFFWYGNAAEIMFALLVKQHYLPTSQTLTPVVADYFRGALRFGYRRDVCVKAAPGTIVVGDLLRRGRQSAPRAPGEAAERRHDSLSNVELAPAQPIWGDLGALEFR